jgi:glycosyltransferase involved in cell wall biosynthesis
MRVALLSVSGDIGGSETSLLELARGLVTRAGIEPIFVVPKDGPLAERARALGAVAHVAPMPEALTGFGEWSMRGAAALGRRTMTLARAAAAARRYGATMAALLGEIGADVIHSNGFKMHVLAARAAPRGVPVVWHMHEYLSPRPLSRVLLRHHVRRAAAVVANSRSVAADLAAALGTGAPISTIYNAVDLQAFAPEGPALDLDRMAGLPPAPPGVCRVGLLATFARWKGHDVFLRAIAGCRGPLRAYVIGAPVYDTVGSQLTVEELRSRAMALGIEDRVAFTGFAARAADAIRALDLVVHASTEPEPFGLVIAEAMACGRAVIVSRAGGAAEIVEDGVDALATAPGDAGALAAAIDRLASDRTLRARLGASARSAAERRFDPGAFVASFADLYTRVSRGAAVPA